MDASRDDIQVSAAASNGGGDSQRAGSIGEAKGEARRGAGADAGLAGRMHNAEDRQTDRQNTRRICKYSAIQ